MLIIGLAPVASVLTGRGGAGGTSTATTEEKAMANVLCVLYDDPIDGYPPAYARDQIPVIERYYDGQTTPTAERIDFTQNSVKGFKQHPTTLLYGFEDVWFDKA